MIAVGWLHTRQVGEAGPNRPQSSRGRGLLMRMAGPMAVMRGSLLTGVGKKIE